MEGGGKKREEMRRERIEKTRKIRWSAEIKRSCYLAVRSCDEMWRWYLGCKKEISLLCFNGLIALKRDQGLNQSLRMFPSHETDTHYIWKVKSCNSQLTKARDCLFFLLMVLMLLIHWLFCMAWHPGPKKLDHGRLSLCVRVCVWPNEWHLFLNLLINIP